MSGLFSGSLAKDSLYIELAAQIQKSPPLACHS